MTDGIISLPGGWYFQREGDRGYVLRTAHVCAPRYWWEDNARRFAAALHPTSAIVVPEKNVVLRFAMAVLHGDDEHRFWLMEAAEAFTEGNPLPPPRGKGTSPATAEKPAGRPVAGEIEALVERFDEAAQAHGWCADRGGFEEAGQAEKRWSESKYNLLTAIAALQSGAVGGVPEELRRLSEALSFFDRAKTASLDEQIAVGNDHWDRLVSAVRSLLASAAAPSLTSTDDESVRPSWDYCPCGNPYELCDSPNCEHFEYATPSRGNHEYTSLEPHGDCCSCGEPEENH